MPLQTTHYVCFSLILLLKVREKHMFSDLHPSSLDRRYYPKLKDIRWHVYAAARSLSLSQVDQVIIHFPLYVKISLCVLREPYGFRLVGVLSHLLRACIRKYSSYRHYVFMYVRLYACMYACTYVCMCVCTVDLT